MSTPHFFIVSIADANRELAAYRKAQDDAQRQMQDIRAGVLGRKSPAQEQPQRQN